VYYSATTDGTAAPTQAWTSPFLSTINNRCLDFIRGLTGQATDLPNHSHAIAFCHPASMGGVGYRDHSVSAIPNFIIALARSIQYAKHGIPINGTMIYPTPSHCRSLTSWSQPLSQRPLFHLFVTMLPKFSQSTASLPSQITSQLSPSKGSQAKFTKHTNSSKPNEHLTKPLPMSLLPFLHSSVSLQVFRSIAFHAATKIADSTITSSASSLTGNFDCPPFQLISTTNYVPVANTWIRMAIIFLLATSTQNLPYPKHAATHQYTPF
jgi:hypothetical protein